jgi:hypothetical protein
MENLRDFASGSQGTSSTNMNRKRVVAPIQREGKTFWLKVGAAFQNKDLSWNLYLDAMPFTGRLQLRDWEEQTWEGRGGRGNGGAAAAVTGMTSLSLPSLNNFNETDNRGDLPF